MPTIPIPPIEAVHHLLFQALIDIRYQGYENKDKLVYHLADLFHNTAIDLKPAAEGKLSYEEVMKRLVEKAEERTCKRWVQTNLARIEERKSSQSE